MNRFGQILVALIALFATTAICSMLALWIVALFAHIMKVHG